MSSKKNRKYTLVDFFSGYFENIGSLTLVNLIFCLPLTIILSIMFFLNNTGINNIFVSFLLIPLMSPFSGGLFYICKKTVREEKISPLRDFLYGIRLNALYFFLDSVIVYVIVIGLYISFSYYRTGLEGMIMIVSFIFSLIFLLFFISFQNNIMTMIVSVKLNFGEILKNSVLMVMGGFFYQIKNILSFSLIAIIMYSVCVFAGNIFVIAVVLIIPIFLFLPVFSCYIIVFNTYQPIEKQVIIPYENEYSKTSDPVSSISSGEDLDELEKLSKGDPDEFVFYKGKMIKRRTVRRILEVHKNS